MTGEIGQIGLIFAIVMLLVNLLSNYYLAYRLEDGNQVGVSEAYGYSTVAIVVATVVLGWCFWADDFGVKYVYENGSIQLPIAYKVFSIWGGHEGSWLLWILIAVNCGRQLVSDINKSKIKGFDYSQMSQMIVLFGVYGVFTSNPFTRILPIAPADGLDLNPLLQDASFLIHPPCLYMGQCAMIIPFVIACNMAKYRGKDETMMRLIKSWTLWAWGWLTLGICLGSWWAYRELGWGGWWFWDPVENAALMPWLVATALIHQASKRGKQSSVVFLAQLGFLLTMVGTLITRSGILVSVHSFATAENRMMTLMIITVCAAMPLLRGLIKDRGRLGTGALDFKGGMDYIGWQRRVMLCILAVVFIGTFYPVMVKVVQGGKIVVGSGYFEKALMPFYLLMLGLMASQVSGEIAAGKNWLRYIATIVLAIGFTGFMGSEITATNLLGFAVVCMIIYGLMVHAESFFNPENKNKRIKLMGHGILLALSLSIVASGLYERQHMYMMQVGQVDTSGGMTVRLAESAQEKRQNHDAEIVNIEVERKGRTMSFHPEIRTYKSGSIIKQKTDIANFFFYDIYVATSKISEHDYLVRVYVKPLQSFFWFFGIALGLMGIYQSVREKRSWYVK